MYFQDLASQCNGGKKKYGGIADFTALKENLRMNCIPEVLLDQPIEYDSFLDLRRKLMAAKMQAVFSNALTAWTKSLELDQ